MLTQSELLVPKMILLLFVYVFLLDLLIFVAKPHLIEVVCVISMLFENVEIYFIVEISS